ncbi:MAG: M56 family metallopeptidase [Armatimonadetes bacterium]|nr:M56 family metallopeptidase [Armatimonadota bacterium]
MWWSYAMDILQPHTLGYIGATLVIFLLLIFPWFSPRTKVIIARWGLFAAMIGAVIPGWYALSFYKTEAPTWRPGPTRSELRDLESQKSWSEVRAMPRREKLDEIKAYSAVMDRRSAWRLWISWALVGGMFLGVFFSYLRLRNVHKMFKGSVRASEDWQKFALNYLGERAKGTAAKPLGVWIHPTLEVPCIATHNGRWTIFLPEASRDWPEGLREIVIRHEVEHIRQNDLFPVVFAEMVRVMTWIAPWAWFIPGLVRKNVELWADQRVIQGGVKASDYADALLKVGSRRAATPLLGLSMGNGGRLEHRIRSAVASTQAGREFYSPGIGVLSLVPMILVMFAMGRQYGAYVSTDPGRYAYTTKDQATALRLTPAQGVNLPSGSQLAYQETWSMEGGASLVQRAENGLWTPEKTWLLNKDQLSGGKRVMFLTWTKGKNETNPAWLRGEVKPYGLFIDPERRIPISLTPEQVKKGSVELILSDAPWKKVGSWKAGTPIPFHIGRYTQLRLEQWDAWAVSEKLKAIDRRVAGTDEFTNLHNPDILSKETVGAKSAVLVEALGPGQEAEDRKVVIYGADGEITSLSSVQYRESGTSDVQAFLSYSTLEEITRVDFYERQGTRIRISDLPK